MVIRMEKKLGLNLDENLEILKDIFSKDSVLRYKKIGTKLGFGCAILYFDGMVNTEIINQAIVRPLVLAENKNNLKPRETFLAEDVLYSGEVKVLENLNEMISGMLYGDTLLLIEKSQKALLINTKGWRTRGISEPEDERVLSGPREGFDEAAMFNLALIRRKLLTPDFCSEMIRVGKRTNTIVFICYLDSLVDEKLLKELKNRLLKIDIDGILDTNYINELIRDRKGSLFKTTGTTERPDVVAARLLEGRIALIVDGTPVVMTLPYLFSENFQSDEDYYINYKLASAARIIRMVCFFLSVSIPAIFISLVRFHFELIPTSFAISVAESRGGVPFSSLSECLLLIFIFEILRETGLRMPQSVGHALSIVGGLVIGQAAVDAKIISAPMLIAVALSGISGLMIPRLKTAVFYLRIIFVLFSSLGGMYGLLIAFTITLIHVLSLDSFLVSETISLEEPTTQGLKDVLYRTSWTRMRNRPVFSHKNNIRKK